MASEVHKQLEQTKAWINARDNIENNIKNDYYGNWDKYTELIEGWKENKKPIIVCVAGKSLDYAIPKIKKLDRDSYKLITIDQTQFKLVDAGLKPDLMFTMDFLNFCNLGFWVGMKNTSMVAPCSANGDNLKAWKGHKYIYRSVDIKNTDIAREYNQKTLMAGDIGVQYCLSNVGLSVLQFCESIQANTYWCGLDFGFIDGNLYCDGIIKKLKAHGLYKKQVVIDELGNFDTTETYIGFAIEFLLYLNSHDYKINYCSRGGFFDIDIKDKAGNSLDKNVRRCELEEIV